MVKEKSLRNYLVTLMAAMIMKIARDLWKHEAIVMNKQRESNLKDKQGEKSELWRIN